MEVVGVVAAVPELLKLTKRLGTAIGHIGNKSAIKKAACGLRAQLELLSEVLERIQHSEAGEGGTRGHTSCLVTILDDARKELEALRLLVDKVEDPKNNGPSFLKRAQLVFTGFDSQLKARSQRIDRFVNLLQVYLTESAARAQLKTQVRKLLKPSTSTTDFIPEKLHGTLEWIWTHNTFLRWMGSTAAEAGGSSSTQVEERAPNVDSRVLLLYGVNGCGKSVLTASIATGLRRKGITTFLFSFWAGNSYHTRSDVMFRTLLWQLLEQTPGDRQTRHMSRLLSMRAELWSTDKMIDKIKQLGLEHGPEIYLIIDGIDESSDDWNNIRDGPLGEISTLVQSISQLRVLLSGRQASLRMARRRWPLQIELTTELVKDDISKFIQHELDNCPDIHNEGVRDCIKMELESKSAVMFLWVKLVFKELRLSFSEAEIHQTLSRLPDQLGQEYHRLFTTLSQRLQGRQQRPSVGMQRAKDILGLIIGAARPLTMSELRLAYAYSAPPNVSGKYGERDITEEGIIDACGDITTLHGELVYLGHTSLREFLIREQDEIGQGGAPTADYFRLDARSCQNVMAMACLQYLRNVSWRGPDGEHYRPSDLEPLFPFLGYAASYLASHFLNSNMDAAEVRGHIEALLNSEGASSWLNFVVSMENDETRQAALPPTFWDEMVQLCISQGGHGFSLVGPGPETFCSAEDFFAQYLDHSLFDGLSSNHADCQNALCQTANTLNTSENSHPMAAKEGGTLRGESLHNVVQYFVSRNRRLDGHPLALILAPVQSCIIKVGAFLNPLDITVQALQGMSFFALMALAQCRTQSEPQQALKLYLLALEKVRGKADLREAWVHAMIGNVHLNHSVAASHFQKSQEILESRSPNPLFDYWCLNAATCRATRLFRDGKIEEAKTAAKMAEAKLLASGDNEACRELRGKGNTLRKQIYTVLDKHPHFVKNKFERTLNLSGRYLRHELSQDTERLLTPLARDPLSIQLLGSESSVRLLSQLGSSAMDLGKMDTAVNYWRKAREHLLSQASGATEEHAFGIYKKIDEAIMLIAESLSGGGRNDLAQMELASLTSLAFLADWTSDAVEYYVARFMDLTRFTDQPGALGGKKTTQFMEENLKHIEDAFIRTGKQKHDAWRLIARGLLSHGIFDEAEGYIRRILAEVAHSGQTEHPVEHLYALEALAFSTRCQSADPKRRDPYDYYLALLDYSRTTEYEQKWLAVRHEIGFGMHCAATDRRTEATRAFISVADGYRDIKCGSSCIGETTEMLFRALAATQESRVDESISMFSSMIDGVNNREPDVCCGLRVEDYQQDVLLVAGHFYLASLFEKCGMGPAMSDNTRSDALAIIEEFYAEQLDKNYVASSTGVDMYVARWMRSCVTYARKQNAGETTSTVGAMEFPFEIFLRSDHESSRDFLIPPVLGTTQHIVLVY